MAYPQSGTTRQRIIEAAITDGGVGGTDATERCIYTAINGAVTVEAVKVSAPVGVTADAANFVTFTLAKRTAGGGATTVATRATDVAGGSLTAFAPSAFTLSVVGGALNLASGDSLTLKAINSGAGVAFGAANAPALVDVEVEETFTP